MSAFDEEKHTTEQIYRKCRMNPIDYRVIGECTFEVSLSLALGVGKEGRSSNLTFFTDLQLLFFTCRRGSVSSKRGEVESALWFLNKVRSSTLEASVCVCVSVLIGG